MVGEPIPFSRMEKHAFAPVDVKNATHREWAPAKVIYDRLTRVSNIGEIDFHENVRLTTNLLISLDPCEGEDITVHVDCHAMDTPSKANADISIQYELTRIGGTWFLTAISAEPIREHMLTVSARRA